MSWTRKVHLYSGLVLSVLMFVFAVTGGALLFKDGMQRARYPALQQPVAGGSAAQHARAFAAITEQFPRGIRTIRVPRDEAALYHVYLDESEAFFSQDGMQLIDQWHWNESLVGILTELHFHLGLGRGGRVLAGAAGLALAVMIVTGLVLFWPFRTRFALSSLVPKSTGRLAWSRLHRDLGLLASLPLLLFGLTAAGVIFYGSAQAFLGFVTGSGTSTAAAPSIAAEQPVGSASSAQVALAQSALPSARLTSYSPPGVGNAVHYFRFRNAGEPHPNGRSAVYIDGRSGELLRVNDATRAPRGERASHWLYPLHAATVGGRAYTGLAVLSAIALTVISISGPAIYLKTRRRKRPRATAGAI